jgi:hypothetical protein
VLGKCSRLTPSQPAQGWEDAYTTRLANQDTSEWPQDAGQLATTCSLPGLPWLTIRQVLQRTTCEKQQGPFKVQLRLIGYVPQDVASWCKARKRSSGGGGDGTVLWEWAVHLLLEDGTGGFGWWARQGCLFTQDRSSGGAHWCVSAAAIACRRAACAAAG